MDNKKEKKTNKNIFQTLINGFLSLRKGSTPISKSPYKTPLGFDSIRLVGNKRKKIEEINNDAGSMIKQYLHDVSGLLDFIERRGTKVIRKTHADKVLILFGFLEGFIYPLKGYKAKLLTLSLKIIGAWDEPIASETKGMFIFGPEEPPIGYMVHQIHHWLSYHNGLPGYTEQTMQNFQRIFDPSFGVDDVKRMSREEIVALREAIARDKEALDFVQKMAEEIFKPQDIIKGIEEGEGRNL